MVDESTPNVAGGWFKNLEAGRAEAVPHKFRLFPMSDIARLIRDDSSTDFDRMS